MRCGRCDRLQVRGGALSRERCKICHAMMVGNNLAREGGRLMAAELDGAGIASFVSCRMRVACELQGGAEQCVVGTCCWLKSSVECGGVVDGDDECG